MLKSQVMRRLKAKELLWLALPCAIPVVALIYPSLKTTLFPPFQPVVEQVHFAKTWNHTNDPDLRSYVVTIYINHTGPRPPWWGKQEGISRSAAFPGGSYISSSGLNMTDLRKPRFVSPTGKTYEWDSVGIDFNLYDAPTQRYVMRCDTDVNKNFNIENTRFVAEVKTAKGTYKINTPVVISPPLV